jgi:hypothetical protein
MLMGHVILALPRPEVHQRDALMGETMDVSDEPLGDRIHQR